VPERRFEPVKNIPNYQDIGSRLGAGYDLVGNGKTALKFSLGQYPDIIRTASGNPASNLIRTTTRTWNDANRNYAPDCELRNPVANGEWGPGPTSASGSSLATGMRTAFSADGIASTRTGRPRYRSSTSCGRDLA